MAEEAVRQEVMLGMYEAGGYEHPDKQPKQLQLCRQKKAGTYIIVVSAAESVAVDISQPASEGRPVI